MCRIQLITTHAIHPLAVTIETSRTVRLEFAAENQVGINRYTGEIIIKEKAQNTLHKYKLQSPDNLYQEIWSENFPHGINTASVIAAYCTIKNGCKIALQDKTSSTTLLLSSDGRQLLDSWHHEGILLACFHSEKFAYAVEKAEGEYEIVIVEANDKDLKKRSEIKLQPVVAKPTWSNYYLSVCMSKLRIAVTSTDHTLDIYGSGLRHGK